jgi:hypothetical protein
MADQTSETTIKLESPPEASDTSTETPDSELGNSNQGEANGGVQGQAEGSQEESSTEGEQAPETLESPFDHQSFNDDLANSEDGKFSQAKRDEALEIGKKIGIPEAVITKYMDDCEKDFTSAKQAGEQQQVDVQTAWKERNAVLGDANSSKQILSWAEEKLSDAELDYYNEALNNPRSAKHAAVALKALYESNTGVKTGEPQLFTGSTTAGSDNSPFKSREEVAEAMGKKDAKGNLLINNPEYFEQVQQRIKASKY